MNAAQLADRLESAASAVIEYESNQTWLTKPILMPVYDADHQALLREAAAELRALGGGWLPIESAPKPDIWHIQLLVVNQLGAIEITEARRIEAAKRSSIADDEPCWYTHWQPLPPSPAATVEG